MRYRTAISEADGRRLPSHSRSDCLEILAHWLGQSLFTVLEREGKENDIMIAKLINSAISGVIGGLTSAVMSVLLAAYMLPMPIDKAHHVVGYGIGGFMCGLLSGFMGVFMHMRRTELSARVPGESPR
ncbi:MAG TPA: hypothetical protein VIV60_29870 [Polyangiaceae bacterium]